jgi:hypothetical protein
LSGPSQNHSWPDTWLRIKVRRKSASPPSCITLLQPLYRWRHQSRKLWMPFE